MNVKKEVETENWKYLKLGNTLINPSPNAWNLENQCRLQKCNPIQNNRKKLGI